MIVFMLVEIFGWFIFWFIAAILVGVFANVRRNRSGFGWFLLSLILSPVLTGILVAILERKIRMPPPIPRDAEMVDLRHIPMRKIS